MSGVTSTVTKSAVGLVRDSAAVCALIGPLAQLGARVRSNAKGFVPHHHGLPPWVSLNKFASWNRQVPNSDGARSQKPLDNHVRTVQTNSVVTEE